MRHTVLVERGRPAHVVANQLGHTDGGALVQRLYGHPSERGMHDQVRLAFTGRVQMGSRTRRIAWEEWGLAPSAIRRIRNVAAAYVL